MDANFPILSELISNEFSLEKNSDYDKLRSELSKAIQDLLIHDINKLMSIFYRIDVSEKHVKEAFNKTETEELPSVLAELVIKRQLQKIETRNKYSNK